MLNLCLSLYLADMLELWTRNHCLCTKYPRILSRIHHYTKPSPCLRARNIPYGDTVFHSWRTMVWHTLKIPYTYLWFQKSLLFYEIRHTPIGTSIKWQEPRNVSTSVPLLLNFLLKKLEEGFSLIRCEYFPGTHLGKGAQDPSLEQMAKAGSAGRNPGTHEYTARDPMSFLSGTDTDWTLGV